MAVIEVLAGVVLFNTTVLSACWRDTEHQKEARPDQKQRHTSDEWHVFQQYIASNVINYPDD